MQADGKILAGGRFSNIGGQTRNFIARLDATTGLADSFNPNANNDVYSLAVQADGKILAGGDFRISADRRGTSSPGSMPTTGLADSFDPNANNLVYALAVQANGKILAGGNFSQIGGQTRNLYRAARCHDRPGRFVRPERGQLCRFNRGAGGRQDFGGWIFQQHRRTDAQ